MLKLTPVFNLIKDSKIKDLTTKLKQFFAVLVKILFLEIELSIFTKFEVFRDTSDLMKFLRGLKFGIIERIKV
jgi:hypothetical protein